MKIKFENLCVWPETKLGEYSVEDFIDFFKEEGNIDVTFVEDFVARRVHYLIFYVSEKQMDQFLIRKPKWGIVFAKDILDNPNDWENLLLSRLYDLKSNGFTESED